MTSETTESESSKAAFNRSPQTSSEGEIQQTIRTNDSTALILLDLIGPPRLGPLIPFTVHPLRLLSLCLATGLLGAGCAWWMNEIHQPDLGLPETIAELIPKAGTFRRIRFCCSPPCSVLGVELCCQIALSITTTISITVE